MSTFVDIFFVFEYYTSMEYKYRTNAGTSAYSIGQRIKLARKEQGLSSIELAKKMGKTRSFITTYETGARIPKDKLIEEFAKALNVSYLFLKNGESELIVYENDEITLQNCYSPYDYLNMNDSEDYRLLIEQKLDCLNLNDKYNYGKMIYEYIGQLMYLDDQINNRIEETTAFSTEEEIHAFLERHDSSLKD